MLSVIPEGYMKIISFKICPFVQRVTALLEYKQAPYQVQYIDLSNKPKWFLEVSPHAQVPILITNDDQVLFESDAIVEYLDEVVGPALLSSNAVKKAQQRAWSYLATKHYLVQCSAQRSADEAGLATRSAKLNAAFSKIHTQLGDAPFIGGDSVGMVDIAWLPLLHRSDLVRQCTAYDFLASFPRVKAWRESLMATGIAQRSVSQDFAQQFAAFYLNDSTYLGGLAAISGGHASRINECTGRHRECCT